MKLSCQSLSRQRHPLVMAQAKALSMDGDCLYVKSGAAELSDVNLADASDDIQEADIPLWLLYVAARTSMPKSCLYQVSSFGRCGEGGCA